MYGGNSLVKRENSCKNLSFFHTVILFWFLNAENATQQTCSLHTSPSWDTRGWEEVGGGENTSAVASWLAGSGQFINLNTCPKPIMLLCADQHRADSICSLIWQFSGGSYANDQILQDSSTVGFHQPETCCLQQVCEHTRVWWIPTWRFRMKIWKAWGLMSSTCHMTEIYPEQSQSVCCCVHS